MERRSLSVELLGPELEATIIERKDWPVRSTNNKLYEDKKQKYNGLDDAN